MKEVVALLQARWPFLAFVHVSREVYLELVSVVYVDHQEYDEDSAEQPANVRENLINLLKFSLVYSQNRGFEKGE